MHDVYSKFSWKIFAIIAIFFVLIILFFSFLSFSPASEKNQVNLEPTPTKRDSSFNPIPTIPIAMSQLKIEDIIVSFPEYIATEQSPIEGGGSQTKFLLYTSAQNTKNFVFNLQVINNTKTSLIKLQEIYISFGYKKSVTQKKGVTEYWFSGQQVIGDVTIQESVMFFEHKNNIYRFNMSYWSKLKQPNLEKEFQNISNTVQFQ